MKREILIFTALLVCLAGCGRQENPYRVDTVIQIPVDPTEAPTEPEPTVLNTEPETEAPAETKAPAKSGSTGKTGSTGGKTTGGSGGGKTSGGNKTNSNKGNSTKETKPAVETEPPKETAPPETEPPTQPPTEPAFDASGYRPGNLEYEVLEQINACRMEAGIPPLVMNEKLCIAAALRAYEVTRIWSHTRPDGRDGTSVISDYGFSSTEMAENLVYVTGNGDAARIVEKWMASEKNRALLLGEGFTAAGVGLYRADGITYLANLLVG